MPTDLLAVRYALCNECDGRDPNILVRCEDIYQTILHPLFSILYSFTDKSMHEIESS